MTVINEQALADVLSQLLATETRSLARHVMAEARPYLTPATYPIWHHLAQIGRQSQDHAQRLSNLISELELPARTIPFDPSVSYYHYVTVESLLPLVINEKRGQIDLYEQAISLIGDYPHVRQTLDDLLAECNQNLEQLRADAQQLAGR